MPATIGLFGGMDVLTPSGRQKTGATKEQIELLRQLGLTAEQQRAIAGELFETTGGLRGVAIPQLESYLRTGELPPAFADLTRGVTMTGQNLYRTGREDLEAQFANARQQIRNEIPVEGGQLNQALINLAQGRAGSVGRLESDIQRQLLMQIEAPLRQNLFSAGLSTAFGQPQVALQGLAGAASSFGSAAGGFGDIASRSLQEQLEREQRHKDELQNIGQMVAFAAAG